MEEDVGFRDVFVSLLFYFLGHRDLSIISWREISHGESSWGYRRNKRQLIDWGSKEAKI